MIQLTEMEFKSLYYEVFWLSLSLGWIDECFNAALQKAKEKGWIKKAKLEEAREAIRKFKVFEVKSEVGLEVQNISRLYEEAISELQDKLKEKE